LGFAAAKQTEAEIKRALRVYDEVKSIVITCLELVTVGDKILAGSEQTTSSQTTMILMQRQCVVCKSTASQALEGRRVTRGDNGAREDVKGLSSMKRRKPLRDDRFGIDDRVQVQSTHLAATLMPLR
jgi:hypothetical protein